MMKKQEIKIFISYAKEDINAAKKLCSELRMKGIDVWFDIERLLPGQHWKTVIKEAIRECNFYLALLSRNSINKNGFVQRELKEALNIIENLPESKTFIIPVRLDDCKPIHEKLNELHWVDLFPLWENGMNKIVKCFRSSGSNEVDSISLNNTGILHNLPQPDYGKFIGRRKELIKIFSILKPYPHSQHAIVTIDGVGGIGKTALALEVANHYLWHYPEKMSENRFDAIIWTSAKQSILTTEGIIPRRRSLKTIEDIFRTISIVLNDTNIINYPIEKQYELIYSILTKQRTLLIVDNLESVDDLVIMEFLRELPAPTKAIITTRHRIDVAYPVRLTGMPEEDALNLINHECIKKDVTLNNEELHRLFIRTGGIPLAIVLSVAQIGFGYSTKTVFRKLGDSKENIARFCFDESINLIRNTNAEKILISLSIFDAGAKRKDIGYVANISESDRDEGIVILEKLSLINKDANYFWMLPLTKNYVLKELTSKSVFSEETKKRWERRFGQFKFEQILPSDNFIENWDKYSSNKKIAIPIGMIDNSKIQYLNLGTGIGQHAMICGVTGSGKTTLIHVILCSMALIYSPKEINIYLVDFKGTELSDYKKISHCQIVAPSCSREYSLSIINLVVYEINKRAELLKGSNCSNFEQYNSTSIDKLPRIILIIDEFMALLSQEDEVSDQALSLFGEIVRKGRAFGVHIILSSQEYFGILKNFPHSISVISQIQIRIALKCSIADSQVVFDNNNTKIASLLSKPGEAIYNDEGGLVESNILFQVAWLPMETQKNYLSLIQDYVSKKWG